MGSMLRALQRKAKAEKVKHTMTMREVHGSIEDEMIAACERSMCVLQEQVARGVLTLKQAEEQAAQLEQCVEFNEATGTLSFLEIGHDTLHLHNIVVGGEALPE